MTMGRASIVTILRRVAPYILTAALTAGLGLGAVELDRLLLDRRLAEADSVLIALSEPDGDDVQAPILARRMRSMEECVSVAEAVLDLRDVALSRLYCMKLVGAVR